ncbi:MAG: phage virion morphogenesis protein [Alphaproteobacteria bacterium]
MITVEINDDLISAALASAQAQLGDMSNLMGKLAVLIVDQTEQRFTEGKSPEGVPWAPRSAVTIANYKRRKLAYGGLLHLTGQLSGNLGSAYGPDFAEVTTAEPYAAMMQFGGTRAAFPNLWGNIPARPFMGLSDENQTDILDTIGEALASALTP